MRKKINLLFGTFLLISGCSLLSTTSTKEIIVLTGCNNFEALTDLEYSVNNLYDFFNMNNIRVIKKKKNNECGYVLIFNKRVKKIDHVMTDYDLSEICRDFYGLE